MTLAVNHRVPGTFLAVEVQEQGPSAGALPLVGLIIGQRETGAGIGVNDTATRVRSADEAGALAGRGSMAHRQAVAWFKRNRTNEVWLGLIADPAGAAATGTIAVSGPATAGGEIALYTGAQRVGIPVVSGDSADDIAAAINAAINAVPDDGTERSITSTVLTSTVTWTYRHNGLVGNDYDVRHSYTDGERLPAGVGLTITPNGDGTGAPSLTALFASIASQEYHVITHPYTDATTLTAIETELTDRASQLRQIPGVAITSAAGSSGTLLALGDSRNSEHSSIVAQPGANPLTPPSEFAAIVAANVTEEASDEPTAGWKTDKLIHGLAPAPADRFGLDDRKNFLIDGISTTIVGPGGQSECERLITTYQLNAVGAPDAIFLDLTTPLTLIHLRYNARTYWDSNFSKYSLAQDGTEVAPGKRVMTPKKARGIWITWAQAQQAAGLIQNLPAFVAALTVVIDPGDSTRLNVTLPVTLISPLYVNDVTLSFTL